MVELWNCSQGTEEVPSYSKQNKSWLFSLIWVCARACLHDSKKGWCNNFRFCPYIRRCFAADFLDLSLSVVLTHVVRLPLGGFYFIFNSSLSFDFFTEEGIWAGFGDFWGSLVIMAKPLSFEEVFWKETVLTFCYPFLNFSSVLEMCFLSDFILCVKNEFVSQFHS